MLKSCINCIAELVKPKVESKIRVLAMFDLVGFIRGSVALESQVIML